MGVAVVKNGCPAVPGGVAGAVLGGCQVGVGGYGGEAGRGGRNEIVFRWFEQAGGGRSNGPRAVSGRGRPGGPTRAGPARGEVALSSARAGRPPAGRRRGRPPRSLLRPPPS